MTATTREMTIADFQECYSDYYKEANGFRPRFDTSGWTLEKWRAEFAHLARTCEANRAEEVRATQRAIREFDVGMGKVMAAGSVSYKTAVRWAFQAEKLDITLPGDRDFMCYKNGLPSGYFE